MAYRRERNPYNDPIPDLTADSAYRNKQERDAVQSQIDELDADIARRKAEKDAEREHDAAVRSNAAYLTSQQKDAATIIKDAEKARPKLQSGLDATGEAWAEDEATSKKTEWFGLSSTPTAAANEAKARLDTHKTDWNTQKQALDAADLATAEAQGNRDAFAKLSGPYDAAVAISDAKEFAKKHAQLTQPAEEPPAEAPPAQEEPLVRSIHTNGVPAYKLQRPSPFDPGATAGQTNIPQGQPSNLTIVPSGTIPPGTAPTQATPPAAKPSQWEQNFAILKRERDKVANAPLFDDTQKEFFKTLTPEKKKALVAGLQTMKNDRVRLAEEKIAGLGPKAETAAKEMGLLQQDYSTDTSFGTIAKQGYQDLARSIGKGFTNTAAAPLYWLDAIGSDKSPDKRASEQTGTFFRKWADNTVRRYEDPDYISDEYENSFAGQTAATLGQQFAMLPLTRFGGAVIGSTKLGLAAGSVTMNIVGKAFPWVGRSVAGLTATEVAKRGAALLAAGITGAITNGGAGYKEAIDNGYTGEQAFQKFIASSGSGLLEMAGADAMLSRLDKFTGGSLSKTILGWAGEGAGEYILNEAPQTALDMLADIMILPKGDPRRPEWDAIWKEANAAGMQGALTATIMAMFFGQVARIDAAGKVRAADAQNSRLAAEAAQVDPAAAHAAIAQNWNAQTQANYKGDIDTDMAGWDAANPAPSPADATAHPFILQTKLDALEAVDTTGMTTAQADAITAAKTALTQHLAAQQITPDIVAIISTLSADSNGDLTRAETDRATAQAEMDALDAKGPETFFRPADHEARLHAAAKLNAALRAKIAAGAPNANARPSASTTNLVPLAREIASRPDAPADPNQNGKPNGSSQRQIALAIAKVAQGIPLTSAELNLRSGSVTSPGPIFQQDKKTGRVTIKNPETARSLAQSSPLLAAAYNAYESAPPAATPANPAAAAANPAATPGTPAAAAATGTAPAATPGRYRVVWKRDGAIVAEGPEFEAPDSAIAAQRGSLQPLPAGVRPGDGAMHEIETLAEPAAAPAAAAPVETPGAPADPTTGKQKRIIARVSVLAAPFLHLFPNGIKIVPESLKSGGLAFLDGSLVISLADAEREIDSDTNLRAKLIEEIIHAVLVQAKMDAKGFFTALPAALQAQIKAAYQSAGNDTVRGHEALRMFLQSKIKFDAGGNISWVESGGQIISEQASPALMARLREIIKTVLAEFKNLRATLAGNQPALDILNESEKAVRQALAGLPKIDTSPAKSNTTPSNEDIRPVSNQSRPQRSNNVPPRSDARRVAGIASQILGRVQRRLFPEVFRFPATGRSLLAFGAEIAAVAAGRKPLFHENFLGSESAAKETAETLAKQFPGLIVGHHKTSIYVGHPEQLTEILESNPFQYDQDPVKAIVEAINSDEIGELLGYGTRNRDSGSVIVEIMDDKGNFLAGFIADGPDSPFIQERLVDYAAALGIQPIAEVKPRTSTPAQAAEVSNDTPPVADETELARGLTDKEYAVTQLDPKDIRPFLRGEMLNQPANPPRLPDKSLEKIAAFFEATDRPTEAAIIHDEILRRAYEGEKDAAGLDDHEELSDAIRRMGGINLNGTIHAPELRRAAEHLSRRGKRAQQMFPKTGGTLLDVLRGNLVAEGFRFETEADFIDAIVRSLNGEEIRAHSGEDPGLYSQGVTTLPETRRLAAQNGTVIGPALFSLSAFHGTPHKVVDHLRTAKIGTGEGAQAYGWGLYFAELRGVAETYLRAGTDRLSKEIQTRDGSVNVTDLPEVLRQAFEANWEAPNPFSNARNFLNGPSGDYYAQKLGTKSLTDAKGKLDELMEQGATVPKSNLYTVELDVEPDELLDWDKPLSGQNQAIRDILLPLIKAQQAKFPTLIPAGFDIERLAGGGLLNVMGREESDSLGTDKDASMRLLAAGIPGIRYLDQGSRAEVIYNLDRKGNWVVNYPGGAKAFPTEKAANDYLAANFPQTYNYVIFDESKIRIVAENGQSVPFQEASQPSPAISLNSQPGFRFEGIAKDDPVTRNESGNVIPLSERFNPESDNALFSQASPGRTYESMDFTPPFQSRRGEILSYLWMNDGGRHSDWTQARTNPVTGREIVHHFKIRSPRGDISTVSLETAMGMLSTDQRTQINNRIKAEVQRRQDVAAGQMMLLSQPSEVAAAMADAEKSFESLSPEAQERITRLAAKQASDAEQTYADALRAHDKEGKPLPAPNGKPSNLNRRQWVQIRTPLFKRWFGDWEAVNLSSRITKTPLIPTSTKNVPTEGSNRELKNTAIASYTGDPVVINKERDTPIRIEPSGIESSLSHGLSRQKRAVVPVLDSLLRGATFIARDTENMRPGVRAVETYAARVSIDGIPFVARLVVREVQDGNRFYDHEISSIEPSKSARPAGYSEGSDAAFDTRQLKPQTRASLGKTLLSKALSVNPDSLSKVVDENGEPLVAFDPAQIKSATGNNGAFSASDDILRSQPSEAEVAAAKKYLTTSGVPTTFIEEATDGISRTLAQLRSQRLATPYQSDFTAELLAGSEGPAPEISSRSPSALPADDRLAAASLAKALSLTNKKATRTALDKSGGRISSLFRSLVNREIPAFNIVGQKIETPADFAALTHSIRSPYFESLKVAFLDSENRVVHSQILFVGTLNESVVHTRDILQAFQDAAETAGGTTVIISHNHPSGDPSPSKQDELITPHIRAAARMAGLKVEDHIITNGKRYYSFRKGSVQTLALDKQHVAAWEAVPRDDLRTLTTEPELEATLALLRQGDPGHMHAVYLSTKSDILAVERLTAKNSDELQKQVALGLAREGGYGFMIDFGNMPKPLIGDSSRALHRLAKDMMVHWIDAADLDTPSWRTGGLIHIPTRNQEAASELFSQPANNPNQLGFDFGLSGEVPTPSQPIPATPILVPATPASTPTAKTPAPKPGNLADFGEKIGGARKDRVASLDKDLSDGDFARKPLSEIWPKSDVDAIEDVQLAAVAHAIRSEIPSKPRNGYKLTRWVSQVKTVRELMRYAQQHGYEAILAHMEAKGLDQFTTKIRLLSVIGRAHWGRIEDVRWYPEAYRWDRAKQENVPAPTASAKVDGRTVQEPTLTALAETVAKKVSDGLAVQAKAKMQFEVRGRTDGKTGIGTWRINKKGDPLYRSLKTFSGEDAKEALAFARNNNADLVQAWEELKQRENVKETDLRRGFNRDRSGADHRQGRDATIAMFQEAFGFRGGEFGNWVAQGSGGRDRQGLINQAFDAFMDMAAIMGVPSRAMSLNGDLAIAFGSRGSGWAAAHYESENIVINLTKTRGAGSLAHEYFHALDHYFLRKRGDAARQMAHPFITHAPEPHYIDKSSGIRISATRFKAGQVFHPEKFTLVEGVRPEVEESFAELVKTLNDSPMNARAKRIDKGKADGYWSRTLELAARSFENYIIFKMQQKGYQNDYLANVVTPAEFLRDATHYPYLLETELQPVAEAFDDLFSTIKTQETDRGIALFSQAADRTVAPGDYPPTLATAHFSTGVASVMRHPAFKAAKEGGNAKAGGDLVDTLFQPEKYKELIATLDPTRPVYIVPVQARETNRANTIPLAFAHRIAKEIGQRATVWTDITKLKGAHNTGAKADVRSRNPQTFVGPRPPAGAQVIVADDTFTSGNTVTGMIDYLSAGGDVPAFAATLAAGRYQNWLTPTPAKIQALLDKGAVTALEFERAFGFPTSFLTGSEAQAYILNGGKGLAGLRGRFAARGTSEGAQIPRRPLRDEERTLDLLSQRGHAQPLDEPVLTPSGEQPMGTLAQGATIADPTGSATTTIAIFPQGFQPVWAITLARGQTTRATSEHLWPVKRDDGIYIMTTLEIAGALRDGQPIAIPTRP